MGLWAHECRGLKRVAFRPVIFPFDLGFVESAFLSIVRRKFSLENRCARLPGQNPRIHAGKHVLKRNQHCGSGIDLGHAPLNFRLPRGIDLDVAVAVSSLKQLPNEPIEFAGRQAAGIFENFGGRAIHGVSLARNGPQGHFSGKACSCGTVGRATETCFGSEFTHRCR